MKRNIQKILSIITAGCVMLPNMTYAFSDLTSKHWAYNAVDKMVEQELLSGYSDGTFRPDVCITRAEFATILSKTLDIKESSKTIEFKDVEGIHWAEEYIDKVNSFLTGYMQNNEYYFKPEDAALREDAAVAIVKAKGLEDENVSISILDSFKDKDSISDNLKKYVAIAVKNGFMNGNEDGTFNPQGNLTRAEVAALFDNAYEKIGAGESEEEINTIAVNINDRWWETDTNLSIGTTIKVQAGETYQLKTKVNGKNTTENLEFKLDSELKGLKLYSDGKIIAEEDAVPGYNGIIIESDNELYIRFAIEVVTNEANRYLPEFSFEEDGSIYLGSDWNKYDYSFDCTGWYRPSTKVVKNDFLYIEDKYLNNYENVYFRLNQNPELGVQKVVIPELDIIPSDIRGLDCEEAVKNLISLDIMYPYEDGEFRPERSITRAEMVVILCKMIGLDGTVINENRYIDSRFNDVKSGEWYTGYINVAEGKGMLNGINEGKNFRPNDKLTMNELLTICVNALGRGEYVSELGDWPANYIVEATKLGLLNGVKTSDANRGNAAMIVWNTLKAPYVWDVISTESNGTINFGNSKRSLLNIYFGDFSIYEDEIVEPELDFVPNDVRGLDCEEAVKNLISLKVNWTYEDGTFQPEKPITRAEMVVILCKMIGIDIIVTDENQYIDSRFNDVKSGEWYTGYINVAEGRGLLNGINEGENFRPNDKLTMNELLTICVNALGRGEYVSELGDWPANYIAEATKLELLDGVKTAEANRGNVAMIVWNTLKAPYVWDVISTESNGTINFGNSERSLLNIHFGDFSL